MDAKVSTLSCLGSLIYLNRENRERVQELILALYDPKADGDNTLPRPNFDHVYFAIGDLDGIYKRAERLRGLADELGDGNLPMGKIAKRPWGERSFYMKDPFGNPLCFVDEKTLFVGPASR